MTAGFIPPVFPAAPAPHRHQLDPRGPIRNRRLLVAAGPLRPDPPRRQAVLERRDRVRRCHPIALGGRLHGDRRARASQRVRAPRLHGARDDAAGTADVVPTVKDGANTPVPLRTTVAPSPPVSVKKPLESPTFTGSKRTTSVAVSAAPSEKLPVPTRLNPVPETVPSPVSAWRRSDHPRCTLPTSIASNIVSGASSNRARVRPGRYTADPFYCSVITGHCWA